MSRVINAFFIYLLVMPFAQADEYRPAYLELQQSSDKLFNMLWKLPAKGQGQRLGLYVELPEDARYIVPASASFIGSAYIERAVISREAGLAGASISIRGLERVATDVLVRIQYLDGSSETARLNASTSSFVVKGSPQFWDVLNTYMAFGVEHILEGADHLLFVACLIFIAGTWRRILVTITGFTIAHSITLTLAALEWVYLPIPPIEAVIALSIVFLAREIALDQRDTLTWRYPVAVSASFGLLHGFGFASALNDFGLPQTEIPTALLAFNVGVEIGQLLFLSAVMAMFWFVGRVLVKAKLGAHHGLAKLQLPIAYAIGSITVCWTIERVSGFWG